MSLLTMATIEEDYVSNETAKLLKEKGFEGYSIITIYDEDAANAYVKELQEKHLPYSSDDPKLKEFFYTKPTLQMAMKWLREVHNIFICIIPSEVGAGVMDYTYVLYKIDAKNFYFEDLGIQGRAMNISEISYEKVVEAAIQYSLKNLI